MMFYLLNALEIHMPPTVPVSKCVPVLWSENTYLCFPPQKNKYTSVFCGSVIYTQGFAMIIG
jgi:hypothetical protein